MALNRKYPFTGITSPAIKALAADTRTNNVPLSGDPCVAGQIPGVAAGDFDATTRKGVMFMDGGFLLVVSGKDSSGTSGADANVAVNGGDRVYFDKTKNPPLSKRAGGIPFGLVIADDGVQQAASGSTTTAVLVRVGV